jgi:hypothetical protein
MGKFQTLCKSAIVALIWTGFSALASVYDSNGTASDVQRIHDTLAQNGDTITLPAGIFTWSQRVTISNAIKLQGQGSGRIIGNSITSVTVGTGNKTFTTTRVIPNITVGQILRVAKMPIHNGAARENFMEGTVTSYT